MPASTIKKGFNVKSSSSFESPIFAAAADDGEGRGRLRRGRRGAGHQRGVQDLEEEHPLPLRPGELNTSFVIRGGQRGGEDGYHCPGTAGYPNLTGHQRSRHQGRWGNFAVSYCLYWPIPANWPKTVVCCQFWVTSGTRAVIATSDSSWAYLILLLLIYLVCNALIKLFVS